MTEINEVAVVGAGNMGYGIAQVAATAGQKVILVDISEELVNRAIDKIRWSLGKLAEKGTIKEPAQEILGRIVPETDLMTAVKNADLIIEAISESIELKMRVFGDIDKTAPPHAIIATNTSSLSISTLSQATSRPDRFIGMHWMNPPVLMRLVEITMAAETAEETLQAILNTCKRYNKEVVIVRKDIWLFLSNRAHMGWNLGPTYLSYSGEATAEEIDSMARYKMGLPMGPFELADFTGANAHRVESLASIKKLLAENPEFEPWKAFFDAYQFIAETVWKPMVEKGLEGVRSGKGFYTYPEPGRYKKVDIPREMADKVSPAKALAAVANTSAWCVTHGVGTVEDVDKAFKLAYGWPKGVFEFVKEYGTQNIVRQLEQKQETAPEQIREFYQPNPLLVSMA